MSDTGIPDEVTAHYTEQVDEDLRLRQGMGELELLRIQEIVRRHLPEGSLRILDVGGGTGIHAEWLLGDGHQVRLIDPISSHVEQAQERLGGHEGFSAEVGDARHIEGDAHTYDAVLLLGPLYHLIEGSDRVAAWSKARRLVTHDGHVFAAAITRFAPIFDGLSKGGLFDPQFRAIAEVDLATGQHRNPTGDPEYFTTAYFHHPDELIEEAASAGLRVVELIGVEGLAAWLPDLAKRWQNPDDRETILFSARATESDPSLRGLGPHIVAVATHAHGHP